jgi:hypothetical protein
MEAEHQHAPCTRKCVVHLTLDAPRRSATPRSNAPDRNGADRAARGTGPHSARIPDLNPDSDIRYPSGDTSRHTTWTYTVSNASLRFALRLMSTVIEVPPSEDRGDRDTRVGPQTNPKDHRFTGRTVYVHYDSCLPTPPFCILRLKCRCPRPQTRMLGTALVRLERARSWRSRRRHAADRQLRYCCIGCRSLSAGTEFKTSGQCRDGSRCQARRA